MALESVTGIIIAVVSSFINGSTFVLHKKGMLRAQAKGILIKKRSNTHLHTPLTWVNNINHQSSSRRFPRNKVHELPCSCLRGDSYLKDVVWWSGTLSSEYSALYL